jgi:hypothetical protein
MRTTRAGLRRIEQLIAEVSQTPMRALIAEVANLIVSIEPPTPTLAANSFSRSEQQVMMVAVPRNQVNSCSVGQTEQDQPHRYCRSRRFVGGQSPLRAGEVCVATNAQKLSSMAFERLVRYGKWP